MNKHVFDLLSFVISVVLFLCIPAGIVLMLTMDDGRWILLTILGLIGLAAGP